MKEVEICAASCAYCIHDHECGEVEGRQSGRGWGSRCASPGVAPHFEPISSENWAKAEAELNEAFEDAIVNGLLDGWD